MRFLFNESETFELALTLLLSAVHLGNQGQNEKDKIRGTLRDLMEQYLGLRHGLYSRLRSNATELSNLALDDAKVNRLTQRDYLELKLQDHSFSY
jgi:hypothetical protein